MIPVPRTDRDRRLPSTPVVLLLVVLALAALLALAAPAVAIPQEDTMTLARLEELLAASPDGTVAGHFLTATRGATIETIPCTILGLVPHAAFDNGDLLLFEASGPVIDRAGGIAAGMSGSPIYVDDSGDKLVGAVSYGETFTDNGLGLATPIEHMMTLEGQLALLDPLSLALGRTTRLAAPVATDEGAVGAVVLAATSAQAERIEARSAADTAVFRPLAVLQMAGVPPTCRAAIELTKALATKGIEVRTGLAGGAAGFDPGFTTPLIPGSSVGELFMRGDYWYGGVGTTTYTTADDVLVAFGHPAMWDAGLSAYMTNADVIGLWNSGYEPHKVVAPGAVRGTIALDSGPGIAGFVGTLPDEVPFTVTATDATTGKTATSTSYATQWAMDQSKWPYSFMNAMAVLPAFWEATGDAQYDGQIAYDLTIDLTNGTDDYTYQRTNVWQDDMGWDAPGMLWAEMGKLLSGLTFDPDGTIGAHITSIAIDADLTPGHHSARVADVTVDGQLKTGANTVEVTMYKHGETAPTLVEVPLTIPAGMSLKGTLYAKAPAHEVESMGDGWYGWWSSMGGDTAAAPQTLADVVAGLNGKPTNDELLVAYAPPGSWNPDFGSGVEEWGSDAIVVTTDVHTYLTGQASKSVADLSFDVSSWPIVSGEPVMVTGDLSIETAAGKTVKIYKREVGATTDTLVTSAIVGETPSGGVDPEGSSMFMAVVPSLTHNATLSAVFEGDADYLWSSKSIDVVVRGTAKLRATPLAGHLLRIRASVTPLQDGATIDPRFVVERRVNGAWRRLLVLSSTYPAGGTPPSAISTTLKLKPGKYTLRNRFLGTDLNGAAVSPAVKVVVK